MQTWSEYYDVFRDDVGLYIEKLNVTPMRYMKMVAACVRRVQALLKIVVKEKNILYDPGKGGYPLGDDVGAIIMVLDGNNNQLSSTGITQFQITIEESIGYRNEEPMAASMNRILPYIDNWGNEARIYTVRDNVLYVYPSYNDVLRIIYYIDYHDHSPSSSQWAGWYVNGIFNADMMNTRPDQQYAQFDCAWKPYTLREYHRQIMSDLWKSYDAEYKSAIAMLEAQKPIINKEARSNYYPTPIL